MRVSANVIFTLATLAAGNVTVQATVTPAKTVTLTAKAGKLVVPIIADTPARVKTIASPETIVAQQFFQNPVAVQTGANKNSSSSPKTPATESDLVVTATDVQVVGA